MMRRKKVPQTSNGKLAQSEMGKSFGITDSGGRGVISEVTRPGSIVFARDRLLAGMMSRLSSDLSLAERFLSLRWRPGG